MQNELLNSLDLANSCLLDYRDLLYDKLREFPLSKICSDEYDRLAKRITHVDRLADVLDSYVELLKLSDQEGSED